MAILTHTVTGNVADLLGANYSKVMVDVYTNLPDGAVLVDQEHNTVLAGHGLVTVTNGVVTIPGLIDPASPDVNVEGIQYRFVFRFADTVTRKLSSLELGWYSITADTTLGNLIAEAYEPPNFQSEFLTEAQAILDAQVAISGIDDSDSAVAALIEDDLVGPLTNAALTASYAGIINATKFGLAEAASGSTNRAAIADALAAAASLGQNIGVYVPAGTYEVSGAAISVPSDVTLFGAGQFLTTVKNADSATTGQHVFTNSDTSGGNTGIRIHDMTIDANGANGTGALSPIWMDNLTACDFDRLVVRGGRNDGSTAGSGSGMQIQRMTRSHIGHVRCEDNDYDGVLFGGCTYNTIDTVHGVECGRNALQLSRHPIGSGTTPSQFNVVGKVVAEHSTGAPRVGTTSPTTGALYFHNSWYNTVGEVIANGTRMGIGGIGTDTGQSIGNLIGSAVLHTRWTSGGGAAIDWELACHRNQVGRAEIRPISGASGRWVNLGDSCSFNAVRSLRVWAGGGSGTWTLRFGSSSVVDNEIEATEVTGVAPSISDSGLRNIVRYGLAGEPYIHRTGKTASLAVPSTPITRQDAFTGASGVVPAGWATRWNQTGATITEDAAGYLRCVKASTGRAGLACTGAGDATAVEVLVKFRTSATGASLTPAAVILRGSGAAAAESGYFVSFWDTTVRINRYAAGTASNLASASFTTTVNTWTWMRVRITGVNEPTVSVRMWDDGSTEPTSWAVTWGDSSGSKIGTPGWHGLVFPDAATVDIDYYRAQVLDAA